MKRLRYYLFLLILLITPSILGSNELIISGGADYPLIHAGIGSKKMAATMCINKEYKNIKLEVKIKEHNTEKEITSHVEEIENTGKLNLSYELYIPYLGFFDYYVKVVDPNTGKEIISKQANVAVVPQREGKRISDFGVCTHFAQNKGLLPYSLDIIKLAGFSSIRDEVYWTEIQRKDEEFCFPSKYDYYIDAAYQRDLSIMMILAYGNPNGEPYVERGFPTDEVGRKRFVSYAEALVNRYKNKVNRWELWNEPNTETGVVPDKIYLPLLKDVYTAIKRIQPESDVICSGGSPNLVNGSFIEPILKTGGREYMNGYAMHTYVSPHTPEKGYKAPLSPIYDHVSIPALLNIYRDISAKYVAPDSLKVWITEVGWHIAQNMETAKGTRIVNIDDLRQAAYTTRLFLLARKSGVVSTTYLYDFQNDGTDIKNREDHFGMITYDFVPKKGYSAMSILSSMIEDKPFTEAIMDNEQTKVYKFGNGKEQVVALWNINEYDAPLSNRYSSETTIELDAKKIIHTDWQGAEKIYISKNGKYIIPVTENPSFIRVAD